MMCTQVHGASVVRRLLVSFPDSQYIQKGGEDPGDICTNVVLL